MSRFAGIERELNSRFAVETVETHTDPGTGAHRVKGSMYLTTEKDAKALQDEGVVRIVGVF